MLREQYQQRQLTVNPASDALLFRELLIS